MNRSHRFRRGGLVATTFLIGFLFALILGVGLLVAQQDYPTAEEMRSYLLKGECADCHREIYEEWEKSGHAQAWTSPLYQEMRQTFDTPETSCDPCHAPKPILMTGVAKMPQLRDEDRERGVDCLTCHLDADGAMRGPYNDPSPFHRIDREPTLYTRQYTLCATCHGQKSAMAHNQVEEFRQSGAFRQGETCQKCHMPDIDRKPSRLSRRVKRTGSHLWPGSRDVGRLESTVLLDYDVDEEGVIVYLTNGAGHSIPAAPLREIRVAIVVVAPDGTVLGRQRDTYCHPLKLDSTPREPGAEDTRPKANETREYRIPLSAEARRGAELTASVLYRRHDEAAWIQMATLRARL